MKYFVISLQDFSLLTTSMLEEEFKELKTVKLFSCPTTAQMEAKKIPFGVVVTPINELNCEEYIQSLNQRIQDLLRENESLQNQLTEITNP